MFYLICAFPVVNPYVWNTCQNLPDSIKNIFFIIKHCWVDIGLSYQHFVYSCPWIFFMISCVCYLNKVRVDLKCDSNIFMVDINKAFIQGYVYISMNSPYFYAVHLTYDWERMFCDDTQLISVLILILLMLNLQFKCRILFRFPWGLVKYQIYNVNQFSMLMIQRKTAVTPVLTHWSYHSLTLIHQQNLHVIIFVYTICCAFADTIRYILDMLKGTPETCYPVLH